MIRIITIIYRLLFCIKYSINKRFLQRCKDNNGVGYSWIKDENNNYIGYVIHGMNIFNRYQIIYMPIYFNKVYKTFDYAQVAQLFSWRDFRRGKHKKYFEKRKLNENNN